MLCHRRHLILLCLLVPVSFFSRSQQPGRADTLVLHFLSDSYRIQPEDSARLLAILDHLSPGPVSITGYTDKTGTIAHNQRLSQQRANAALNYIRRGQATGGGIAPTFRLSDSENRRVEIVYYSGKPVASHDTIRRDLHPFASKPAPHNDSIVVVKQDAADSATALSNTATATPDSTRPSAVLALHRINFIVDTPIPTDSTRAILPQFIAELRQFKDHHLEIDGYVNSIVPLRGANDPLFKLSVNRAKFIYDYLVNAGFDPGMLTYKGMGNASPINPHPTTKEEMNANMRVEIKVF